MKPHRHKWCKGLIVKSEYSLEIDVTMDIFFNNIFQIFAIDIHMKYTVKIFICNITLICRFVINTAAKYSV